MSYVQVSLSKALADAEVFTDGDWVESKDQDPTGDVRLTQLADVGDGFWINKSARFMTAAKARELRCTYLQQGDVLVARMPDPLGRCCIFPGDAMPCVTVVDVCVIRPNAKAIDSRYLMHAINSPPGRHGINSYITGTTRQRISRSNLGKLEIPLPPLAEQKRIAGILDAADALRAKRREALAQLDTLLQATFLDLFGDPAKNDKGLPISSLGDLGDWRSGGTPSRTKPDYFTGTIPWFSSGELNTTYVIESVEHITQKALNESAAKTVKKGALMLGMYDTAALKASIAGIDCACNQAIAFATIKSSLARTLYVHSAISIGREHFRRLQRGVRQKNLSLAMIKDIRIPLPMISDQDRYVAQVECVERLKTTQRAHLAELNALFASLQSRAFRGEL